MNILKLENGIRISVIFDENPKKFIEHFVWNILFNLQGMANSCFLLVSLGSLRCRFLKFRLKLFPGLDVVFWERWIRWWNERYRPSNYLELLNVFQKRVNSFSAFVAIRCWCHVAIFKTKIKYSFRSFFTILECWRSFILFARSLVWLTWKKVIDNILSKCIQSRF